MIKKKKKSPLLGFNGRIGINLTVPQILPTCPLHPNSVFNLFYYADFSFLRRPLNLLSDFVSVSAYNPKIIADRKHWN